MSKVSKSTAATIIKIQERVELYARLIHRIETGDPTVLSRTKEKGAVYYRGLMHGSEAAIETLLFDANAFSGFIEITGDDHAPYRYYYTGRAFRAA